MGLVEIPTEKYNQMVETQNKIIKTVKEIYPDDWKDVSLLQDVRNVDLIKGELRQLIRAYKSEAYQHACRYPDLCGSIWLSVW